MRNLDREGNEPTTKGSRESPTIFTEATNCFEKIVSTGETYRRNEEEVRDIGGIIEFVETIERIE